MKIQESPTEVHERRHFDRYASKYDSNYHYLEPFTQYKIAKKFRSFADFINISYKHKKIKILDIGCGTGEYTRKIAEEFPKNKVLGLDISPGILAIAKKKCVRLKNTSFVTRSAYDTKFPSGSIDVVAGYYVLHHLDPHKLAPELKRILKPGGKVYFYEPNILNPVVYFIKSNRTVKKALGDSPDEWAINPITIAKAFTGFKPVTITTSEFVWPINFIPLKLMIALDTLLSYFKHIPVLKYFGGSVEVVLRKK